MTLTTRIEKLETENILLRKFNTQMRAIIEANVDDDRLLVAMTEGSDHPRGIGRPQLISARALKNNLLDLLLFLSPHVWPQFKAAINQATNANTLAYLLQKKCPYREGSLYSKNY